MDEIIYLDHASTTPTDPAVVEAMLPWHTQEFGNPARSIAWDQRGRGGPGGQESIAATIGAEATNLFTSGGTESDNWAIAGTADAQQKKGRHLITSTIEHHAVLETMEYLEKRGCEVTRVPVDTGGLVDPNEVRKAIRPDTILVSIMHGNNEVGTIEPVAEIGKITREAGVLFHSDVVQTAGKMPLDVNDLGVDMLSMSAHKFYGPKGVGLMYLRKRTRITPLLHGGAQERNRRAGTLNVPGIMGMAKALELCPRAHGRRREARGRIARSAVGRTERRYRGDLPQR
jgi:cysteine desulfurase